MKKEISRSRRLEPSFEEFDYFTPIALSTGVLKDKAEAMNKDQEDCFGKEHDMRESLCVLCADNEMCGLYMGENTRAHVKEMEKIEKHLDVSKMDSIDSDAIAMWLSMGKEKTTEELYVKVALAGNSEDEVAIVEWMKRFLKRNDLTIQEGVIKC